MTSNAIVLAYVARHGTTILNESGKFRGAIDVPLDAKGRRDAKELAAFFDQIELCGIVASSRKRSTETARIIGSRKGIEPVLTDVLFALDVGDFSGEPKNKENRAILHQYILNPDRVIPGGESLNNFRNRVRPAIMEALDIANNSGAPILLVGHSSIVHEVGALINGSNQSALVEPGGVAVIYSENGHLKAEAIFKPKRPSNEKIDIVS